jgi:hypothetical protein
MTGVEDYKYECEAWGMGVVVGTGGMQVRRFLPRWPTFPVPVLAIIASSSLTPTLHFGPRRNVHTSQHKEAKAPDKGGQPHLPTQLCPQLLPSSSHSLGQPKPQHCIKDSKGHRNLHSVCLGPCDSPPIGAQSALLAQSRAKSSNNPSTPLSIKENASKTAPP